MVVLGHLDAGWRLWGLGSLVSLNPKLALNPNSHNLGLLRLKRAEDLCEKQDTREGRVQVLLKGEKAAIFGAYCMGCLCLILQRYDYHNPESIFVAVLVWLCWPPQKSK